MPQKPLRENDIATDDDCCGYCECPRCGAGAHWSFFARMHACSDPECGHQFKEHNAPANGWDED